MCGSHVWPNTLMMRLHPHGPQYRSVVIIGDENDGAGGRQQPRLPRVWYGSALSHVLQPHRVVQSCATATPCCAVMRYGPIVLCSHALLPHRVVQACALMPGILTSANASICMPRGEDTAPSCRAGMSYSHTVLCRHALLPHHNVQACATAPSCCAGMRYCSPCCAGMAQYIQPS